MSRKNKNGNPNYSNQSNANSQMRKNEGKGNNDRQRHNNSKNKNVNSAPAMLAANGFHEPDRSHNDPQWFKDSRGLVEEAARYGNYQPTGRKWLVNGFTPDGGDISKFGVPSALFCEYIPCPGISQESTSAMSIAAQQIYQHIRRSLNKVLTGYQFADVVVAYTCFMSLVIQAKELIRDYSVANSWSTDNFAYPYGILGALGYKTVAAKDLINNMANYRQRFNTLMYQASSIFLPFETNHLLKYKWMASGLWGDKDNPKAQVYGYTSMGYYVFEETADPDNPGSKAKFTVFDYAQRSASNTLFKQKLDNLEACITALRNSDSFNYMMSDLRTAYSDINGYVFDSLEEDASITIDYNDVMLRQFQNIRTLPPVLHNNSYSRDALAQQFNITQDVYTNTVLCHPNGIMPYVDASWPATALPAIMNAIEKYYYPTNFLMNWGSSNPDVDEVIECTNGAIMCQWDDGQHGFDIDEGMMSCYVPIEFRLASPDDTTVSFTSYNIRPEGGSSIITARLWQISMFDWFPMIYDVIFTNTDLVIDYIELDPFIEDDVLAPISYKQLSAINKAEQYALWRVAETGNIG